MNSRYDPPARITHHFTAQLDTDWINIRRHRRSLRTARAWATDSADDPLNDLLRNVNDLDQILAATRGDRSRHEVSDRILLRLVSLAKGDELAGRIVIQRILPGLISRSAQYRNFHDNIDTAEIVVPAAWLAMRAYNVGNRPRHVAASLQSDAVFFAFRQPLRRQSASEVCRPPRSFSPIVAPAVRPTDLEDLADVVRDAQKAGVPTYDIDLIRHLVHANSPAAVARERNVTPRTIRNHRARAIEHIREALSIVPVAPTQAIA
jgi:hypothetical protein